MIIDNVSQSGGTEMAQCDHCMDEIETGEQTHVRIVKPMEFKGETEEVTQYYCTVECLLEKLQG
jgi:hypothetical protein